MRNPFRVIVVIAVQEEADALIQPLGLVKRLSTPFNTYENANITLIVSGIGLSSASTAVGFAAGLYCDRKKLFWLNIGTAGHKIHPIGTVVLPAKISTLDGDPTFFPTPIFSGRYERTQLITISNPKDRYPAENCVDMEALGFCAAANKFSLKDYIHVVKIISDNAKTPVGTLQKGSLKRTITLQLKVICDFVRQYIQFAHNEIQYVLELPILRGLEDIHFTETQKITLKKSIRRLLALNSTIDLENLIAFKRTPTLILKTLSDLTREQLPKVDRD